MLFPGVYVVAAMAALIGLVDGGWVDAFTMGIPTLLVGALAAEALVLVVRIVSWLLRGLLRGRP